MWVTAAYVRLWGPFDVERRTLNVIPSMREIPRRQVVPAGGGSCAGAQNDKFALAHYPVQ